MAEKNEQGREERTASSDEQRRCVPEDFLGHLIHDLRSPVTAIGGYAKRLESGKMGTLNEGQRGAVEAILKNCERLEHDLRMILQHISSDLTESLSTESFDLVDLLTECLENYRERAGSKGVSFVSELPGDHAVRIEADAGLVGKAVHNLLDNALKYTDEGGKVTVSLSEREEDVDIAVSDTGRGIEKERLEWVMQPFEQVMGIDDRRLRGFGLGLSNVKRYVEMHAGRLFVDSEPGQGSTFTIRLPRGQERRAGQR